MLITMSISSRALLDRRARLVGLDVGRVRAEREADHGAHLDAGAAQQLAAQRHPGRVHAHRREAELRRLAHSCSISSRVASGLSSVWSISEASPSDAGQ